MSYKKDMNPCNVSALRVYADMMEDLRLHGDKYFIDREGEGLFFFIGHEGYENSRWCVRFIDLIGEGDLDYLMDVLRDDGDVVLLTVETALALINDGVKYDARFIEGYKLRRVRNVKPNRDWDHMDYVEDDRAFFIGEPFDED